MSNTKTTQMSLTCYSGDHMLAMLEYCDSGVQFAACEYDHEISVETYHLIDKRFSRVMVSGDKLTELRDKCVRMAYDEDDIFFRCVDDFGDDLELYSCDGMMEIEMVPHGCPFSNEIVLNKTQVQELAAIINKVIAQ